jgi:Domain of unknown function DUF11
VRNASTHRRTTAAVPALLCALALALLLAGPARGAATIVVTSTADSGAGTLRDALAAAGPGDTISIPGTGDYQVSSAELAVTKNVSIVGSGPDVRLVADGNNRVFNVTAANVTISGLTVTGGGSAGVETAGGGVANGTGALTLQNVTITGNSVTSPSGGIPHGGGVSNDSGTLQIVDSTITSNSASTAAGGGVPQGGGVANGSGTVTITRTTLSDDTSKGAAGAVPQGGAVYSRGGQVDIVDSSLNGNQALAGQVPEGGAIFTRDTALTITGTTLARNSSSASNGGSFGEGGAVEVGDGSLAVVNSTITNNSTSGAAGSSGGGILLSGSTFEATDATIASNSAAGPGSLGGNLSFSSNGANTFKPRNTIVADGTAESTANCAVGAGTTIESQGHNLESLNECNFTAAGDLVNTDPKLGDLDDNGGPTETRSIPLDSPALNGGANASCPATDQRGVARPQDGTCDIGAFERAFSADLSAFASGQPQSVPVGVPFTMKLGVNNSGPDLGAAVLASGLAPAGARLVSATASQGSCDLSAGTCTLGSLASGSRAEATVVLLPTKPGLLTDSFRVGGRAADPNSANDAATISVRVTPLSLTGFTSAHRRFRLGTRKPRPARRLAAGTRLQFKLSAPARVTLVFARQAKGRHARFVRAGAISVNAKAGAGALRFQGRLSNGKSLRPGNYRVTATAKDAFGNTSKARRLTLRLLPA